MGGPSRARPWLGPALVALAAFVLHAAAWDRYGVFRDELYFIWGWPPGRDVALVISGDKETCSGFASRELLVKMVPDPLPMPYESGRWIWACRAPTRPVAEIWAAARNYI